MTGKPNVVGKLDWTPRVGGPIIFLNLYFFNIFLIFWLNCFKYFFIYIFFENSGGLGTSARTSEKGHMGGVPL